MVVVTSIFFSLFLIITGFRKASIIRTHKIINFILTFAHIYSLGVILKRENGTLSPLHR